MKKAISKARTSKVDTKEFELPETVFVRDIENRVFQGIVLQCLAKIDGITLVEGNFIDNILGRDSLEGIRGIHIEQDSKHQCVSIRVEINICYGISIPEKAEEVQAMIAKTVTELTGLHVSNIHVIFRNTVPAGQLKNISDLVETASDNSVLTESSVEEEYNEF